VRAAMRGRTTRRVQLRGAERRDAYSREGHGNTAHAVMKASDAVRVAGEEHGDCGVCRCKDAVR